MQKEKRVDFRCNSFIEFCIQANAEEISWLNRLFGHTDTEFHCKFLYDTNNSCIGFRLKGRYFYEVYRWGVCGGLCFESKQIYEIIQSYPWTLRSNHSASILTREALLCIYDCLKDPRDMWSFMQVNKRFHHVGTIYPGYRLKICKLMVPFFGTILPFGFIKDERKRFFALCFISCNKNLEKRLVEVIGKDYIHPLLRYCFNLSNLSIPIPNDIAIEDGFIFYRGREFVDNLIRRGGILYAESLLGTYNSKFPTICESIRKILKDK